jgi:hypothetical protein
MRLGATGTVGHRDVGTRLDRLVGLSLVVLLLVVDDERVRGEELVDRGQRLRDGDGEPGCRIVGLGARR